MKEKKNKKRFLKKLKTHYRLMVYDDNTFHTVWSMKISQWIIVRWSFFIIVPIIIITVLIIFYTPLRQLIPGYPPANERSILIKNAALVDSLAHHIRIQEQYLNSIQAVIHGEIPMDDSIYIDSIPLINIDLTEYSLNHDSVFQQYLTNLKNEYQTSQRMADNLSALHFNKPVDGKVNIKFDNSKGHLGVDLIANEDSPIIATLNGTVIQSSWTPDTGYVIVIQHKYNLVSIYKHNKELLKKAGEKVKAGETIAIIGNTGELSKGPHLHFELWHNGKALDPLDYITF